MSTDLYYVIMSNNGHFMYRQNKRFYSNKMIKKGSINHTVEEATTMLADVQANNRLCIEEWTESL